MSSIYRRITSFLCLQRAWWLSLSLVLTFGCGPASDSSAFDPALDGLSVSAAHPKFLLPLSTLVVQGHSFVGQPWGQATIVLEGEFNNNSETYGVHVAVPATFVDLETLHTLVDNDFLDLLGASSGEFVGTVRVEIQSSIDNKKHASDDLAIALSFRNQLTPTLTSLYDSGPLFVNDEVAVIAEGLLLGGEEGTSSVEIKGCFTPEGQATCVPIEPEKVGLVPYDSFNRSRAAFAFRPSIAGIGAGTFEGSISLINQHYNENETTSSTSTVEYELSSPAIFTVSPSEVSLGQFLDIEGGGFVKTESGSSTLLELRGQYIPEGGRPLPLDILLVPDFSSGRRLRYTMNEDDTLGQRFDLRYARGQFSGDLIASVSYDGNTVESTALPFTVEIAPVRQIVYLKFTTTYLDALRAFGLRAMDSRIRQRVAQVVRRDFRSVNLEVRLEEPTDFSLYSIVEIGGQDPNGLGLLGYDNTPGKDSGNERLHDHIGGVNATTQQDGYPGYGGVFIESLFVFSTHPGNFAPMASVGDPLFDEIFDAFRPDRKGLPVRSADLSAGADLPSDGSGCPAQDRVSQIGCATWTLANLIGSTISHEIGHSVGLANPDGGGFHHLSDAPNRLMDSGSARPFSERAELAGQGPGQFCVDAYEYLRIILPTTQEADLQNRPSCF